MGPVWAGVMPLFPGLSGVRGQGRVLPGHELDEAEWLASSLTGLFTHDAQGSGHDHLRLCRGPVACGECSRDVLVHTWAWRRLL